MIKIDGSYGEGGGQILRTALALSACTGKPFQIDAIRAGRKKPGLLRQHLTCVSAATKISAANVIGAEINSTSLTFIPGQVNHGQYDFSVGTAGSTMLVLQTILPPLLLANGPSKIIFSGGTHNLSAPTFHFIEQVFLYLVNRHYAECHAELEAWGFFPAGGGKASFNLNPIKERNKRIELISPGKFLGAETQSVVSRIPCEIAEDECKTIVKAARFEIKNSKAYSVSSAGPGNVAWARLDFDDSRAMFTGFGELGVSRQRVAADIFKPANDFFSSNAAIDEHLADQIIVLMALCGGGKFTTTKPSLHTTTNLDIIKKFLTVEAELHQLNNMVWSISIT